ncbi:S1/P1 nuclease [Saccharicrinis aurantiacus]|uniref:S1/P1 nuclease n=1 Tax=Saccharicrinis aurantiacus TaxID=1849719 RepID=UPI00094F6D8B|nr:S1/P1 nuclease [Saccharicrinis aurantiacus]
MKTLKISLLFVCISLLTQQVRAWGSTGHRAIAKIAYQQLSEKTKAEIEALLGSDYIPIVANWADEIRSEKDNKLGKLPHYVNMPLDKDYQSSEKNSSGDIVTIIEDMKQTLQSDNSSVEDKIIALKMLVHLVGDAHQPMHVGLSEDLGGNKVEVNWFGKKTNLHKLWDEEIIDYSRLSYTELATFACQSNIESKSDLKLLNTVDWVNETHEITRQIYNYPGDKNYSYAYVHRFNPVVLEQIQKAGYRLGNLLNSLLE